MIIFIYKRSFFEEQLNFISNWAVFYSKPLIKQRCAWNIFYDIYKTDILHNMYNLIIYRKGPLSQLLNDFNKMLQFKIKQHQNIVGATFTRKYWLIVRESVVEELKMYISWRSQQVVLVEILWSISRKKLAVNANIKASGYFKTPCYQMD